MQTSLVTNFHNKRYGKETNLEFTSIILKSSNQPSHDLLQYKTIKKWIKTRYGIYKKEITTKLHKNQPKRHLKVNTWSLATDKCLYNSSFSKSFKTTKCIDCIQSVLSQNKESAIFCGYLTNWYGSLIIKFVIWGIIEKSIKNLQFINEYFFCSCYLLTRVKHLQITYRY